MPTPALTDDDLAQVVRVWREHECKPKLAAEAMGMKPSTFDHRLAVAKQRGLHLSDGARGVVASAKLAPSEARGGWLHSYDSEGKKIGATRWAAPEDGPTEADILARIAAAFADIPAAPPVAPPEQVQDDLCAVWPLYDVHWGMHAWGKETGGDDYDLKLAQSDLLGAFERVLAMTPFVGHSVLLIGGDFFHSDDNRNETPGNRHRLDADGRFMKAIDTAVQALEFVIQRLQSKATQVTVRVLRGNHDEHAHLPLLYGLDGRFARSRVNVIKDPRDMFEFQWGRTAIFGHHGDKMKPQDMVLRLADQCPFWSETRHRYAYTGHRHRLAEERIGGVHWQQLDAFCPPDAYGSTWTGRRAFKAEVFSKQSGRVLSAHDPLERAA